MQGKKLSIFPKVFLSLLICVLFANTAFAAMRDSDFLELCKRGSLQQINDAIKNGANVNAKNNAGMSTLMWAAESNTNLEVITALINAGANINAQTQNGFTPLIWAARSKNANSEVIIFLLNAGADPSIKNSLGRTAMDYAWENEKLKDTEAFRILQKATSQNTDTVPSAMSNPDFNNSALFYEYGTLQQVNDAIKSGANVNAVFVKNSTPLMIAAMYNHDSEVVKALVNAGADINARNDLGFTSLICAAIYNPNSEMTKVLIEAGSDVNAKDDTGNTALMRAIGAKSSLSIIIALINAGTDVNIQNKRGFTPLMDSAGSNPDPKVIKALVKAGADINAVSSLEPLKGFTPLIIATINFDLNPEVVITLLELGADPKVKNSRGRMAIDYAKHNLNLRNTDALKKLEEASR